MLAKGFPLFVGLGPSGEWRLILCLTWQEAGDVLRVDAEGRVVPVDAVVPHSRVGQRPGEVLVELGVGDRVVPGDLPGLALAHLDGNNEAWTLLRRVRYSKGQGPPLLPGSCRAFLAGSQSRGGGD